MRSNRSGVSTVPLILLAISSPLSGQFDRGWEFVVPGASLVAGIDWQNVSGSEFGRALKQQFAGGRMTSSGELDFVQRFDWAIVSATDAGGRGRRPSNALAFLSGEFNLQRLRQAAVSDGGKSQQYAGVEMLSKPGAGGPVIGILDETALLLGDEGAVKAALGSRSARNPLSPLATAAKAAQGAGVWLIANGLAEAGDAPGALQGVSGLALSIRFTRSADVVLTMNAADPRHTASLAAGLGLISGMLPAGTAPPQVRASGSRVTMELSLTPEQIKAGAQQFATAMMQQAGVPGSLQSILGDSVPKPVQNVDSLQRSNRSPAPKPAERQVIRIHGMEGGVREIPLEKVK